MRMRDTAFQPRTWIVGGIAICMMVSVISRSRADTIADSLSDWSATGTQGDSGWTTGYRNFTADGGGDYATSQFIPFDLGTHWDGSQWRLSTDPGATGGPWTLAAAEEAHPNGTNSTPGEEHWVVRRWVATTTTPSDLELRSHIRKNNVNCGDGTSVNLYHNGSLLNSIAINGNDGVGVTDSVYTTVNPGDTIDLAMTPVGPDTGRTDGCDGTAFRLTVTDDPPPEPPVPPLADSGADWSTTGTQGEENWFNGYYNKTQDADGMYQASDFTPFDFGSHWATDQWRLTTDPGSTGGPWTQLGQTATHPNGTNSTPNDEHWTIRRYVASGLTQNTPVALNWTTAKTNANADGVTGILFVNGQQVDSATIAGGDTAGVDRTFYVHAAPDDVIDLALTPQGLTNDSDGADGSVNGLTIRTDLPEGILLNPKSPAVILADSMADFSDTQGQGNWSYGYYDQRADVEVGDGAYGTEDFIAFLNDGSGVVSADPEIGGWKDSPNHWDGSKWDLLANAAPVSHGPWTEVTAGGGHPAANSGGDPEVHWALRRWVSDQDGYIRISGNLNNTSANGDGTVGRILVDGTEVWSQLSNGDAISFDVDLEVSSGSVIDFAIDPDGNGVLDPMDPATLGSISDGSDGTTFQFNIQQMELFVVPEPSGLLLLSLAFGGLLLRRRR